MENRTAKQIRDHYNNCLDSTLKKNKFTKKEDDQVMRLFHLYGNRWTFIASQLTGRSGDAVKNRFYGCLWKRADEDINFKVSQSKKTSERKEKKKSHPARATLEHSIKFDTSCPSNPTPSIDKMIPLNSITETTKMPCITKNTEKAQEEAHETYNSITTYLDREKNDIFKLLFAGCLIKTIEAEIQERRKKLELWVGHCSENPGV